MLKKISYIIYLFLRFLDNILKFIFKKSFLFWFKEFLEKDSYQSIVILNKHINFFIPNQLTQWRIKSFFEKEPETLEWIDTFDNTKKFIFWDIGANIGIYSIYAALKHSNCEIISFEPSTSNLRTLSRNISINNLEDKIKIFTNPLSNNSNKFLQMKEENFIEGGALNSFGEDYNFEGKKFKSGMKYQLLGKSINSILDDKMLEEPNHIKIDVDGIEHLILEGGNKYLKNENLISLSVEINENFVEQYEGVLKIMKDNNFNILHKKNNKEVKKNISNKHSNTYNYIFVR
ncbi:FkbM family methyltransferase [Candidatus Pelagibacter bacterium]|nr:FkbM family methyltransferase [Candidatus Pelagibacter bacterium]|tara:strand:+ start:288 stop:1154 length:867 start_codon:yes stop_codon:yes gene_type:complete